MIRHQLSFGHFTLPDGAEYITNRFVAIRADRAEPVNSPTTATPTAEQVPNEAHGPTAPRRDHRRRRSRALWPALHERLARRPGLADPLRLRHVRPARRPHQRPLGALQAPTPKGDPVNHSLLMSLRALSSVKGAGVMSTGMVSPSRRRLRRSLASAVWLRMMSR